MSAEQKITENLSIELSFTPWRPYIAFRAMSLSMHVCVYVCLHRQHITVELQNKICVFVLP